MQQFVQQVDPPAYAVLSEPGMPIVGWNAAACDDLLWTFDEVAGRPIYDVVRPSTKRGLTQAQAFQRLLKLGGWAGSTVLLDRLGREHAYDAACCPVWDELGELHWVTMLYAPKHQIAGMAREEVESNFPQIATAVLDGVSHVKQRSTGVEGQRDASCAPMNARRKAQVARSLRLARHDRGMLQKEVAKGIPGGTVDHSVISTYENGGPKGHEPSDERLDQLALVLGIQEGASWFYREHDTVPPPPEGWTKDAYWQEGATR